MPQFRFTIRGLMTVIALAAMVFAIEAALWQYCVTTLTWSGEEGEIVGMFVMWSIVILLFVGVWIGLLRSLMIALTRQDHSGP